MMTVGIIVGTLSYAAVTGFIWLGLGSAVYKKLTGKHADVPGGTSQHFSPGGPG